MRRAGERGRTVVMRVAARTKPFSLADEENARSPAIGTPQYEREMRGERKAAVVVTTTRRTRSGHRGCHSHANRAPPIMHDEVEGVYARCIEEALEVVRMGRPACRGIAVRSGVIRESATELMVRARYSGDAPRNRKNEIAVKERPGKGCRAPSPRGGPSPPSR